MPVTSFEEDSEIVSVRSLSEETGGWSPPGLYRLAIVGTLTGGRGIEVVASLDGVEDTDYEVQLVKWCRHTDHNSH